MNYSATSDQTQTEGVVVVTGGRLVGGVGPCLGIKRRLLVHTVSSPQNTNLPRHRDEVHGEFVLSLERNDNNNLLQTIFVYLACLLFALLLAPAEGAPAPAPTPVTLESLLLAKLLFLKGYLVSLRFTYTQY